MTIRCVCCLLTLCVAGRLSAAGPPQAEQSEPERRIEVITNSLGMKLARIPAGEFRMGSPPSEAERNSSEVPHEVEIAKPFLMGVHEVTQREYQSLMGTDRGAVFDATPPGGPNHPMENVLWEHAVEFCKRLSQRPEERRAGRTYRLPTEAEWEYACRAGTTTAFHFGDTLSPKQANFNGNYPYGGAPKGPYLRKTAPVGSYEPNAFGLYDMHGNVSEWCADWFDPDYYRDSPREDPLGPPVGVVSTDFKTYYLVVRGGSWLDDARACRSAFRFRAMPNNTYRLIGFRVACDVSAEDRDR